MVCTVSRFYERENHKNELIIANSSWANARTHSKSNLKRSTERQQQMKKWKKNPNEKQTERI